MLDHVGSFNVPVCPNQLKKKHRKSYNYLLIFFGLNSNLEKQIFILREFRVSKHGIEIWKKGLIGTTDPYHLMKWWIFEKMLFFFGHLWRHWSLCWTHTGSIGGMLQYLKEQEMSQLNAQKQEHAIKQRSWCTEFFPPYLAKKMILSQISRFCIIQKSKVCNLNIPPCQIPYIFPLDYPPPPVQMALIYEYAVDSGGGEDDAMCPNNDIPWIKMREICTEISRWIFVNVFPTQYFATQPPHHIMVEISWPPNLVLMLQSQFFLLACIQNWGGNLEDSCLSTQKF